MTSHRVLIAVSTSRYSRQLVGHAVEAAAQLRAEAQAQGAGEDEEVSIDILYVIEKEDLAEVGSRVGNEGFLGLSPQADVLDALGAEHHRMATRRIAQIQSAADRNGYPTTITEVEGRFVDAVIAHAEARRCEVIVITRADRPFISRLLFGSEADRVARLARKEGLGEVLIRDD